MDGQSDSEASSPRIEKWEFEQVQKVAARFPEMETRELEAELAVALLELKRRQPPGIRDWKAYLTKSLLNRASTLLKKWRAIRNREISIELRFKDADAFQPAEPSATLPEPSTNLAAIRGLLDDESCRLLQLLAECRWNQSCVGRRLGKHRNTIRYRLQKIRRTLRQCPIENVSGLSPPAPRRPRPAPLKLTGMEQQQLTDFATLGTTPSRINFRARLILALASGHSYAEIKSSLNTTAPTISRWKQRFEKKRIDGLKAKHRGRKPRTETRTLVARWLAGSRQGQNLENRSSCRKIARAIGSSKSTVQRIIAAEHRNAKSR